MSCKYKNVIFFCLLLGGLFLNPRFSFAPSAAAGESLKNFLDWQQTLREGASNWSRQAFLHVIASTRPAVSLEAEIRISDIALKDSHLDVRLAALHALGELKAQSTEAQFNTALILKETGQDIQIGAIRALGKMKAAQFAREVLDFLKSPRTHVKIRVEAVQALGNMGRLPIDVQQDFSEQLFNSNPVIQKEVLAALIKIENLDSSASYNIIKVLAQDAAPEEVRILAVNTLNHLRPLRGYVHLALARASVYDSSPHVRHAGLFILKEENIQDPEVGKILMRALSDSSLQVRSTARTVLQEKHLLKAGEQEEAAAPRISVKNDLIETLNSHSPEVRLSGVQAAAYGRMPLDTELETQIANLVIDDADPRVRLSAAAALGERKSQNLAAQFIVKKALADGDQKMQLTAIRALGGMKAGHAAGALAEFLSHRSAVFRKAAVQALGQMDFLPPDVQRRVAKESLRDTGFGIQGEAVRALLKSTDRMAVQEITKVFKEDQSFVLRRRLAQLLGGLNPSYPFTAQALLDSVLHDPSLSVQKMSVEALRKVSVKGSGLKKKIARALKNWDKQPVNRCAGVFKS